MAAVTSADAAVFTRRARLRRRVRNVQIIACCCVMALPLYALWAQQTPARPPATPIHSPARAFYDAYIQEFGDPNESFILNQIGEPQEPLWKVDQTLRAYGAHREFLRENPAPKHAEPYQEREPAREHDLAMAGIMAGNLLLAQACLDDAHGRSEEAVASALSAIDVSRAFARGGGWRRTSLFPDVVQRSLGWIEANIAKLDSDQAARALDRLNVCVTDWPTIDAAIRARELEDVDALYEDWATWGPSAPLLPPSGTSESIAGPSWLTDAGMMLTPRWVVLRQVRRRSEAMRRAAETPSAKRRRPSPAGAMGMTWYQIARLEEARAAVDLVRVMLALQLYHERHGSQPDRLADLAALLGGSVPVDVLSGEPFHYESASDGYHVWSVGLDGRDD